MPITLCLEQHAAAALLRALAKGYNSEIISLSDKEDLLAIARNLTGLNRPLTINILKAGGHSHA